MMIVVCAWVVFVIGTAVTAAGVALFQPDAHRRKDAVQVLRTVLGAGTALGVMASAVVRLHEAGLV